MNETHAVMLSKYASIFAQFDYTCIHEHDEEVGTTFSTNPKSNAAVLLVSCLFYAPH
jgi:hypothetical protein